jgi:hypothetical protein
MKIIKINLWNQGTTAIDDGPWTGAKMYI